MILTVLEANVPHGQEAALQAGFAAVGDKGIPAGLVRSELVRDAREPQRWRLQSWWSSREALEAMRSAGTPAGLLIFRAAGVEPALSVFHIVANLPAPDAVHPASAPPQ